MSEREDNEPEEPKVIHLHGRDFAGASFAANEEEQTRDQEDPNAEPDIDDNNTVDRIQDHGLTEP
jgi:hypothetical protein